MESLRLTSSEISDTVKLDSSTNEIVIYTENESYSGAIILLSIEVVTAEEVASSDKF